MHMNRKKNLFFRKSVESIQVNSQERKRGESQLDILKYQSFLARVVLRSLSQILFKKYEIDFKNKGCSVC